MSPLWTWFYCKCKCHNPSPHHTHRYLFQGAWKHSQLTEHYNHEALPLRAMVTQWSLAAQSYGDAMKPCHSEQWWRNEALPLRAMSTHAQNDNVTRQSRDGAHSVLHNEFYWSSVQDLFLLSCWDLLLLGATDLLLSVLPLLPLFPTGPLLLCQTHLQTNNDTPSW